jgi:hypothetical protein
VAGEESVSEDETMRINAKFATRCPKCWKGIAVGEAVEWERGKKALHVACVEKLEVQKAMYAIIDRHGLEKVGYRIAHIKKGANFANMHEVKEALYHAGTWKVNRIGERKPGWFAKSWKECREGLFLCSFLAFPGIKTLEEMGVKAPTAKAFEGMAISA